MAIALRRHMRHSDTCCHCQVTDEDVVMPMLSSAALDPTAMPVGAVDFGKDWLPALSDDGASVGCNNSLKGSLPGTFISADAGGLTVGEKGAKLNSNGSYIYCLRRRDKNGKQEVILRRQHHTPNSAIPVILVRKWNRSNMATPSLCQASQTNISTNRRAVKISA